MVVWRQGSLKPSRGHAQGSDTIPYMVCFRSWCVAMVWFCLALLRHVLDQRVLLRSLYRSSRHELWHVSGQRGVVGCTGSEGLAALGGAGGGLRGQQTPREVSKAKSTLRAAAPEGVPGSRPARLASEGVPLWWGWARSWKCTCRVPASHHCGKGLLCDILLTVGDIHIPAHQVPSFWAVTGCIFCTVFSHRMHVLTANGADDACKRIFRNKAVLAASSSALKRWRGAVGVGDTVSALLRFA